MELSLNGVLLSLSLLFFTSIIWILASDIYTWYYLPPGPLLVPFLGNLILLSRFKGKEPWHIFEELSKIYGPIYTLWIGRFPNIIVTDPEIAFELLATRSSKYSSRARSIVYGDIYDGNSSLVVLPFGPSFTFRRKILHTALKSSAVSTFRGRQEAEASKLAYQVLTQPDSWSDAILRFSSSVSFSIAYGRRIDSLSSSTLKARLAHIQYGADLLRPGRFLVETFHFLSIIPKIFTPWLKVIREKGIELANFDISLVDTVRNDLKANNGIAPDSLTKVMLEAQANEEPGIEHLNLRHFASLPSTIFVAGTETTSTSLSSAILALITHPHVLRAAQREIDSVVGTARSPNFSDFEHLPYINAIVHEVLRWRPAAPLSVPHASIEDDIYNDFKIPAGTTIITNTHAMNTLPSYFPSPSQFHPERFLPPSHPLFNPALVGEKEFPGKWRNGAGFGWGRRACAVAELALDEMFIVLAKLVWGFEIRGVEGEVYDVDKYERMLVVRPRTFGCGFVVRSVVHREVMEREVEVAEGVLEEFGAFE